MGLINQDIKNLVSGISQQPPILRHPEQLEEQLNGFSSEAKGLQKRPPTLHRAVLQEATLNKPLVHFIDRDDNEKYCIVFDGNTIRVYDLEGNEYPVKFENDISYIQNTSPRENFKCITVADYTFIVNRTVKAKMSTTKSTNRWATQGLLVNIKSGQYGRTYRVTINGETIARYKTPDGSASWHAERISTDYIAQRLEEYLEHGERTDESTPATGSANPHWQVTRGASWVYITPKDSSTINSFNVYDGYNNQAAYGFLKTTPKFSNLPATAPDGFTVLVKGEDGSDTDDYYVKYSSTDKVWKETLKPNITYTFLKSTLPHVLVREEDGTFTFRRGEWEDRTIGDDNSNPEPSFIGFEINDIFYHRNRLGFLAGENVILSRSAEFFNFWMTSATKVQETDPIDLAASANTICTLYNAVPYDEELIIFAQDMQFSLKSASVLTPKDAVLTSAITHYGSSTKAKPVNAGRNIYFTAERSQYTTVREFFTAADNTESKDVQDITSHIPSYIPNGVYKIIPSTIENILLFLTEGEENAVYTYKYLFVDGQRQQAAWSKWDMQDKIMGGTFMDSFFYMVIERNGYLCLERMSFTFDTKDLEEEPYRVLLDRKVAFTVPSGLYDELEDKTTIDFREIYSVTYVEEAKYTVITSEGVLVDADNGIVVLNGDYTGEVLTVGIKYTFKITLSTIMVKRQDNVGTTSLIEGRLQLRQGWFNFSDSGFFKVTVEHPDKKKRYEYLHTSRIIGTLSNVLGKMPFTTGTFKFPIQSWNDNCVISLETDEPLPISLVGAGWIGKYVRRSQLFQ